MFFRLFGALPLNGMQKNKKKREKKNCFESFKNKKNKKIKRCWIDDNDPNISKLPRGIHTVREHLEKVDNVKKKEKSAWKPLNNFYKFFFFDFIK